MLSISSFLGGLPPASLAAADLPRFLTRVLNRRSHDELQEMLAVLDGQVLSGYPPSLGPVMRHVVMQVLEEELEPASLDPDSLDRLMSRRHWLQAVSADVEPQLKPLRPGVPLSDEVREVTGSQLEVLAGQGQQLVLVCPLEIVTLPGLGWSTVRGPVLARLMDPEEAEALRDAWVVLEECFGWGTEELFPWEARYVEMVSRFNHRASEAITRLTTVPAEERVAVWRILIDHMRDRELPEKYRPGLNQLWKRFEDSPLRVDPEFIDSLLPLARAAYQTCEVDQVVARGLCPCTNRDVEQYLARAAVTDVTRERLGGYDAAEIGHLLRTLSAVENHDLDADLGADLTRDLKGLRDGLLALRYRKDVSALWGIDPLLYAASRCEVGDDVEPMMSDLRELGEEARQAAHAMEGVTKSAADSEGRQEALNFNRRPPGVPEKPEPEPEPTLEESVAQVEASPIPSTAKSEAPTFAVEPMTDLPPLPKPPRRNRPTTETKIELPPLPDLPVWDRPASSRRTPSEQFDELALPPVPDIKKPQVDKPSSVVLPTASPRPSQRAATSPSLVTPGQAISFYEDAFKELEVLERDVLERGDDTGTPARLAELARLSAEIAEALGPAARSGDREFEHAMRKVAKVEAYVARLAEALANPPEKEPERKKSRFGFFKKKD